MLYSLGVTMMKRSLSGSLSKSATTTGNNIHTPSATPSVRFIRAPSPAAAAASWRERDILFSPLWVGGLTVALVGMIGDLLADNLMSFRTVAPISVSMIVWNAVFARALLGERMTRHLAGGTGLVLTGVAMTTLCVSDDNHLPLSTKEVHRSYLA